MIDDGLVVTRLNHAVSYLLARDVNVLSAAPVGASGNATLRAMFFHLLTVLRPEVFCDVGANDGATALAVRTAAPACETHAYEANPEIHAQHASVLASRGVIYRNLAISDVDGPTTVYAPRRLSRAYVDGGIVPAAVVEERDTGKTSLLQRNEDAAYDSFEVEARTLDSLFAGRTGPDGTSFFLWVDVEGAAERVLTGAREVLTRTLAVFVECENFPFWREGSSAGGVAGLLFEAGFVPVARDREYGDDQFNVLFVAGRIAHLLTPALFDARSAVRACLLPADMSAAPASLPKRAAISSVAAYLQAEVPVLVPCFNNLTYTTRMVSQLRALGFRQVVLVDNGSTYPPMQRFLAAPRDGVSMVMLPTNLGPHHLLLDPATFALLPRHFCITDPDLVFNPAMPADFLGDLAALAARERIGKAGLALDISDRDAMRDDTFSIEGRDWKIWEWEKQFWRQEVEPLRPGGDPVYRGEVDTTFALYDKNFFDVDNFLAALRVAGRFTCRHLPWYRDKEMPEEEERFYRGAERFSYYLRERQIGTAERAAELAAAHAKAGGEAAAAIALETTHLQNHLTAIYRSRCWRYTSPVRMLGRLFGRPRATPPAPDRLALSELREQIDAIRRSTSWRLTGPLRVLMRSARSTASMGCGSSTPR
jgi:FkbM family methyltransferase